MHFSGTIGEFAEMIDADYATAAGIVRFLTENGIAEKTGSRASKSGKGKPSSLYTFPLKLKFDFQAKTKVKAAV